MKYKFPLSLNAASDMEWAVASGISLFPYVSTMLLAHAKYVLYKPLEFEGEKIALIGDTTLTEYSFIWTVDVSFMSKTEYTLLPVLSVKKTVLLSGAVNAPLVVDVIFAEVSMTSGGVSTVV